MTAARFVAGRNAASLPIRLLRRIVRPFYSVEEKSCVAQLQQDFGDFPPTPLRCEGPSGEFDVIRTRGIGEIWQSLVVMNRTLKSVEVGTQYLSEDFIKHFGNDQVLALRHAIDGLGRSARFIRAAAIALWGVTLTIRMVRSVGQPSRVLGCFVPVRAHESEIIIKSGRHTRSGRSDAATISHEHIHLLQHRDSEVHLRIARMPQELLEDGALGKPFLLYLLQRMEVEARLHEAVLSFYRAHRQLPQTVPTFLGMLAAGQKLGETVRLNLNKMGVPFTRPSASHPDREALFVEELEWILVYIKPELTCRFVTEVLTVMYGNLLRYYGDEVASRNFLQAIKRPNLYDDLYGAQAT